MPAVERKRLPPPNSTAVTITEADRVHPIERVIVHPQNPVPVMSERESGDAED